MNITYEVNKPISVTQFKSVLSKCSLGERRPLNNETCLLDMLTHANLLITAWCNNELIGVCRCVTDYSYCCYLSDLAVIDEFQHQGVGKGLIEATHANVQVGCKIILLSAPAAADYYPHIGFTAHNSAWVLQKT